MGGCDLAGGAGGQLILVSLLTLLTPCYEALRGAALPAVGSSIIITWCHYCSPSGQHIRHKLVLFVFGVH